jgi:hypothetical protein
MPSSTSHIQSRLQIRDLPYTSEQLSNIASQYNEDTAVILGKRESEEGRVFGMVLIILIVRNRRPVTIMTRRQSQNFDKRNFSVNRIVYL